MSTPVALLMASRISGTDALLSFACAIAKVINNGKPAGNLRGFMFAPPSPLSSMKAAHAAF